MIPQVEDIGEIVKERWRVRKTLHDKWVCDIGEFTSYEQAAGFASYNLGGPEEGAKLFPIYERTTVLTKIYPMP